MESGVWSKIVFWMDSEKGDGWVSRDELRCALLLLLPFLSSKPLASSLPPCDRRDDTASPPMRRLCAKRREPVHWQCTGFRDFNLPDVRVVVHPRVSRSGQPGSEWIRARWHPSPDYQIRLIIGFFQRENLRREQTIRSYMRLQGRGCHAAKYKSLFFFLNSFALSQAAPRLLPAAATWLRQPGSLTLSRSSPSKKSPPHLATPGRDRLLAPIGDRLFKYD
jgi:hypothetical protein